MLLEGGTRGHRCLSMFHTARKLFRRGCLSNAATSFALKGDAVDETLPAIHFKFDAITVHSLEKIFRRDIGGIEQARKGPGVLLVRLVTHDGATMRKPSAKGLRDWT